MVARGPAASPGAVQLQEGRALSPTCLRERHLRGTQVDDVRPAVDPEPQISSGHGCFARLTERVQDKGGMQLCLEIGSPMLFLRAPAHRPLGSTPSRPQCGIVLRHELGADVGAEHLATANTRGCLRGKETRLDGHLDEAIRETVVGVVDQTFAPPPAHQGEIGNALGIRGKNHLGLVCSQKGFQLVDELRRHLATGPVGARAPESDEGEAPFVPGPHPVCAKDLEKRVDLREGTGEDRLQINADEGKLGPPKGSAWKRKSVRRSKHADEREDEDCPERWRNGVPGEPKIGQDPEAKEKVRGGGTHQGSTVDPTYPQGQAITHRSPSGQEATSEIEEGKKKGDSNH